MFLWRNKKNIMWVHTLKKSHYYFSRHFPNSKIYFFFFFVCFCFLENHFWNQGQIWCGGALGPCICKRYRFIQLASEEANWSGATLFVCEFLSTNFIRISQIPKSIFFFFFFVCFCFLENCVWNQRQIWWAWGCGVGGWLWGPCICKQYRFRSTGLWRSQLIWS